MTATLMATLCIALILGPRTRVQAGTLPKPRLWAEPPSVIPRGGTITLWCEGPLGAQEYGLYKEGSHVSWTRRTSLELKNGAKFSIPSVTEQHAGRHRCFYRTPSGESKPSDPLELVVTGVSSKPSLAALPSPVATSGGNVTLQCGSRLGYDRFILTEEGGDKLSRTLGSQRGPRGQVQALFRVGPVTPRQRWMFRCYGRYWSQPQVWSEPSDPLELLFSGTTPKPQLRAQPGSVIPEGSPVTLWCEGTLEAQRYHLYREGSPAFSVTQTSPEPRNKARFSIPSMREGDAGRYRCYYRSSAGWSEPSEPLELVVTGVSSKPSLAALPSPEVTSGGNVTLQCASQLGYDRFILTEEGGDKLSWTLDSQRGPSGQVQALFRVGPVAPRQRWTFRCYGCYSNKPQVWSNSSDTLELLVSGGPEDQTLTPESGPQGGSSPGPVPQGNNQAVTGVSVSSSLLLLLLFFLFFLYWHRGRSRKADAVMKDTEPEDRVELDTRSPPAEDPQGVTYAQVKHSAPRRGASPPSAMSGQLLDTKDGQAEEDRLTSTKTAAPEGPQDVTYAVPCRWTLRQGAAAPPSFHRGPSLKSPACTLPWRPLAQSCFKGQ
ncbi:PREDICTED: LOW QUALITY PROTEIN: leukocyte immunoglobulin-like receptor subfamily A member 3 [Chinchilla lanigera]|uniref:LOW QUALITY PROTEIN: leukocyte immunoglobulin-like receptor subfamily A member 3 n=1 Tax=Chinchilla lanigera TaxID=34839 RepID=UPI0006985046|nr:PREDICTED: LOW QUALITY PROTEIN: leukocyte immunoglobulin-like receptor subfamily A member 3 [Chinchilla lanigera]